MKKVLILALTMLTSVLTYGQDEYNKWAVSAEFGVHSVSDASAIVTENFNHYGLDVRYNINTIVGVGVRGGFDNIQLNTIDGDYVKMNYGRINAEATISLFEILRLRHKNINFLLHGGPGISFIDTDNDYNGRVMNVAGGMTALVKLSRSLAFKADYTSAIHISQDRTLDGAFPINNAGVNSVVDNLSLGFVGYFGRGKKHNGGKKNNLQHADWYVAPTPEPTVPVVNNITQVTEVRETVKEVLVKEPFREYVFFEHDKFDVTFESDLVKQPQNPLYKAKVYMMENQFATLVVTGFASDTESDNEYNFNLSKDRVDNVKQKLVDMGVPANRIEVNPRGKDFNYSNPNVHDIARRVDLTVK